MWQIGIARYNYMTMARIIPSLISVFILKIMNEITQDKLIQFKIVGEVIEQESTPEAIALRGGFGLSKRIEAITKLANDSYKMFKDDREIKAGNLTLMCINAINALCAQSGSGTKIEFDAKTGLTTIKQIAFENNLEREY